MVLKELKEKYKNLYFSFFSAIITSNLGDAMNRSYMYANGNIHIFTDKLEKEIIEYTDSFEEKLISQNKLELYEKLILRNESCIEKLETKIKSRLLLDFVRNVTYISAAYAIPIFIDYFCRLDFSCLEMNLNEFTFVTALIGLIFGVHESNVDFKILKEDVLEFNARKRCRDKFTSKYNEEKHTYEKLLSSNTKELEDIYHNEQFVKKDLGSEEIERKIQEYFAGNVWYEVYKKDFIKKYKNNNIISSYKNLIDLTQLELIEEMIQQDLKEKVKSKKKGGKYAKTK